MALTKLDNVAALIAIDLQKGILGMPGAHPLLDVISRTARLAHAFRERGWPVVLVNVTGRAPGRTDAQAPSHPLAADWTELVPELAQQPTDFTITKQRWGAFTGTPLDDYLKQRGVTQVFLTGVATTIGVESTARGAYDRGYNVVLVVDAMTDRDAEAHLHAVHKVFPRLGESETTDVVVQWMKGGA